MKTTVTPKGNVAYLEYTFEGIPLGRAAYTVENVIKIQPGLEDDKGLLAHEMTHADQWHEHFLFNFRYRMFEKFRLRMEVEAYAAQLKEDGNWCKIEEYAGLLSENYNLGITKKDAMIKIIEASRGCK